MTARDVFEHVGDAICCLDRDWRVVDLNPAAVAFFEVEPASVLGQNILERRPVGGNEALRNALFSVMQSRQPLQVNLYLPDRDRWTDTRIFPLADDGLGISWRDISEQKKREADLVEAVENQEMLFRELTHGVTNTLQEVAARVRIQSRNLQDQTARDVCKQLSAAIHSRGLVYSRLYSGNNTYAQDLGEYVKALCEDLAASLPEKCKLTVATELGAEVPVESATTVGIIIAELVMNAGKHAWPPDHPGRIKVDMRRVDGWIEVEVRDDGRGVAQPRAPNCDGLGLKLVQTHARRLKGRFEQVQTQSGAGFLLRFPAPDAMADTDEALSAP